MTLEKMKNVFDSAAKYPAISRVGVFGSYARGEETKTSDIDIILEYKPPLNDEDDEYIDQMGRFMEDIEKYITLKIDYITLNGLHKSKNETFKNTVLQETRWLYDSDN